VTDEPDARVRILNAAEKLFAQRGFDATATSAVATRASVPKGLLFYYFPTKADLLRALVGERLSLGPIDCSAYIEPGKPVESLLGLTRRIYELQRDSDVMRVIVWREQRTHPEVMVRLQEYHRQLQGVIERVLKASVPSRASASRLGTAAQAWVAILMSRPLEDRVEIAESAGLVGSTTREPHTEGPVAALTELAELICDGLTRRARRTARTTPTGTALSAGAP
jgi:AcrR family transcriptional regulator